MWVIKNTNVIHVPNPSTKAVIHQDTGKLIQETSHIRSTFVTSISITVAIWQITGVYIKGRKLTRATFVTSLLIEA